MDDRRSRPRLSVSLDAMWDSSTQAQRARVTNLSEDGCYLDTVGEVTAGEIVGFRILLPGDEWLYLEGQVRHLEPGKGFGVQFVELNEDQQKLLDILLKLATVSGRQTGPLTADLVEN